MFLKLGDFGLVKVKTTVPTATSKLGLPGTLTHMAPELFGKVPKRPNEKTDVWRSVYLSNVYRPVVRYHTKSDV